MKRFLTKRVLAAALIGLCMAFGGARTAYAASSAPSAAAAASEVSLRYAVSDDGSCTVEGSGDGALSGKLVIPASLDGHTVTAVADNAFRGCDGLTCVLLPDSLRGIGSGAFADCEKLEHIDIPSGVTAVGKDAFPGWEHFAAAKSSPETSPVPNGATGEADVTITYETERFYPGSGSFPQELLKTIRDAIMAGSEDEIPMQGYNITTSQITSLKAAVREAYPMEYAAAAVRTSATRSQGGVVIGLWMYPNTEIGNGLSPAKRYQKLAAVVNPVVTSLRSKSDFEKILCIHDKLALDASYDLTYSRYRAYEIIVDNSGVCQAYSEAMQLYLTLLGVPCNVVPSDGMNHAWNMVKLGGSWYHVDVTWDDPVPDIPGEVQYSHLLCTDDEITALDHYGWASDVTASSTAYSAMPRTDSTMQCFRDGKWYYLDDDGSDTTYDVKSCQPDGRNASRIAAGATGGVAVHHDTLLYGKGETVATHWLTDGQNGTLCALTQAEKDLSDYNQCRILSLSVDENNNLGYEYRIWRYDAEKQHYTSDTARNLSPVSLPAFFDPLEALFTDLDALPETISSQAQADTARSVLTAYSALKERQLSNVSAARKNRIGAVRAALEQFEESGIAVTQQPASVSGAVGSSVSFTVKADGDSLSYQWYYRKAGENAFTAWNKKTAASVSTPVYASWNGAQFYCAVTDGSGQTVHSNTVTLTVTPRITQQPVSASGAVGDTVSFTVKATGAGLSYQWYYRKANESSFTAWNKRTAATASTPVYQSWNGAQFYCQIRDANGKTLKTNTVTLTANTAFSITQQPSAVSGTVGSTASFTVRASGTGLSYKWYYKKSGASSWTAWNNQTAASASITVYASWNGAQFCCDVTDAEGKTLRSNAAALTVTPQFTKQPSNASGKVGDKATFSVSATGTGLRYQWYYKKSGQSSWTEWSGRTGNSSSLTVYKSWNGAQFRCKVTDANGKVLTSSTAKLTVK